VTLRSAPWKDNFKSLSCANANSENNDTGIAAILHSGSLSLEACLCDGPLDNRRAGSSILIFLVRIVCRSARQKFNYLLGQAPDDEVYEPYDALAEVVLEAPFRRLAARPFHGRIEWLYRRLNRSPLHSSSAPRDDLDSQSSLATGRPLHSRGSTPIRFALCRLVPADQRGIASRTGIDLKDLAPGPKHRAPRTVSMITIVFITLLLGSARHHAAYFARLGAVCGGALGEPS